MTLEEMCSSCIHRNYCMSVDCKDHWCGNHTGKKRRNERNSAAVLQEEQKVREDRMEA